MATLFTKFSNVVFQNMLNRYHNKAKATKAVVYRFTGKRPVAKKEREKKVAQIVALLFPFHNA